MDKTVQIILKAKNEASKEIKGIGSDLSNLNTAAKGLGKIATAGFAAIEVAATAAAGAMIAIGTNIAKTAFEMERLSESTGINAKDLQELGFAAKMSDVNVESFAKNLQKMSKNAITNAKDFELYGISVRDATGKTKSAFNLFLDTADALSSMSSETEKVAAAQKLFGKSGAELLPLINQGSEAIRAQAEEADKLGVIFSDKLMSSAVGLRESFIKAQSSFVGLVAKFIDNNDVFTKLDGVFQSITEGVVEASKVFNTVSKDNENVPFINWTEGFKNLAKVIISLGESFKIMYETTKVSLAGLGGLLQDAVANIRTLWDSYVAFTNDAYYGIKNAADLMADDAVRKKLDEVADIVDSKLRVAVVNLNKEFGNTGAFDAYFQKINEYRVAGKTLPDNLAAYQKKFQEISSDIVKSAGVALPHPKALDANWMPVQKYFNLYYKYTDRYITQLDKVRLHSGADWDAIGKITENGINNIAAATVEYEKALSRIDSFAPSVPGKPKAKGKTTGAAVAAGPAVTMQFQFRPTQNMSDWAVKDVAQTSKVLSAFYVLSVGAEKDSEESKKKIYEEKLKDRIDLIENFKKVSAAIAKTGYKTEIDALNSQESTVEADLKASYDRNIISYDEYEKMMTDTTLYYAQKRSDLRMQELKTSVDMMSTWGQQVTQIGTDVATVEINQIERRRDSDIKALEAQGYSAEYSARKREEINAEYDQKVREEKKKQQKWAIASAIISGGVAVMGAWENAMKLGPPANIIAGIISSGLITGLTIAEVGSISSQNFAKGGVVQGNKALGDAQSAMLTAGEVVLNDRQQGNLLMRLANNPAQASSIRGGDTYVTIQGNADEAILNTALRRSRQSQMQDMKMLLREMQYTGVARIQVA